MHRLCRNITLPITLCSAANADQVHQAFTSILKRIVGEIADPPDVNQLMSRSIRLGRNLSSDLNIDYKKRLYQRMLVNPQDLTDKVDWLKPKPSGIGGVGVSISQ